MTKKAMLVILDGWGHSPNPEVSAIDNAHKPFVNSLYEQYPHAELTTFGHEVGLPDGQMGNSEVGHLNIGAGRIVYQELARINKALADGTLQSNDEVQALIKYCLDNKKPAHLLALVSDGGVHAHIEHLMAVIEILATAGVTVRVHAFLDGRDTRPTGGKIYIENLLKVIKAYDSAKLVSIIGRYYSMDRDLRWDRIKRAYDLLVDGVGSFHMDPVAAIQSNYDADITDEFMEPLVFSKDKNDFINADDAVFFLNFRTDRPRQLTTVLTQEDRLEDGMKKLPLYYLTMTEYNAHYENINVVFKKDTLKHTIGEVIAQHGLTQLRIAETEKYPHVTFFFSGGKETEFAGEKRILVNSPKVATYDLQPEMSAFEVTEKACTAIEQEAPDFIVLNYANADMVGHTGDFEAAVKAVETLDICLRDLIPLALNHEYQIVIIADHGNSDCMINSDGSPNTAHTTNPVPIILVTQEASMGINSGILADVAPTILALMHVEQPEIMTGKALLQ